MIETKEHYLSKLPKPSLSRDGEKYYEEMQDLAYHLVYYVSMNDNPSEHPCQGNYNLTFLEENMTEKDYLFIVDKLMRRIPLCTLKEMYRSKWGDEISQYLLDEEQNELKNLKEKVFALEQGNTELTRIIFKMAKINEEAQEVLSTYKTGGNKNDNQKISSNSSSNWRDRCRRFLPW